MPATDTAVAAPSREAGVWPLGLAPVFAGALKVGRRYLDNSVHRLSNSSFSPTSRARQGVRKDLCRGRQARASAVTTSDRFAEIRLATRC